MRPLALFGARVFDGSAIRDNVAVLVAGGMVIDVVGNDAIPADAQKRDLGGGLLAPGFIDLQVNGGAGVMLNDGPDVARMEQTVPKLFG